MFKLLWGRLWPYIVALAALAAAVIGIRQSGKAAGKQEACDEQIKSDNKGMNDARNEIDALDGAAVRDRARKRMRDAKR